jgi:hypothetical protein
MWHRCGEKKTAYRVVVGKSEGRYNLEDKGAEDTLLIKLILNWMGRSRLD